MSGIGGWLDTGHSAMENQQIIDHMARLLARFDSNPAQITVQGNAALSVVAKTSHAHLYEKEGLLVGIWGRIKSENEHVQATINAQGMAAALADLWRQKGEKLLSDFAGEFVCCIVDKQAHKVILAIDPLGTHTLYYQLLNNGILFGSSADALLVHPQADQTIHPQGLLNYLYFHMIPGLAPFIRHSSVCFRVNICISITVAWKLPATHNSSLMKTQDVRFRNFSRNLSRCSKKVSVKQYKIKSGNVFKRRNG